MKIAEHVLDPAGIRGEADIAGRIPALGSVMHGKPDRPDVLIVSSDPGQTDDELRDLGRALSLAAGRLLPQDAGGALERDVFDRHGPEGPTRYSASSVAAPMHTDGMHVPDQRVPEYFSLTCIRQATSGGDLALVHLRDVLGRLTAPGEADRAVRVLSREFWFHTKGVDPRGRDAVRRPVLEGGEDGLVIQYAREYIDLGHAIPRAPDLDDEQLAVLDRLDRVLADRTRWHERRLGRGDVALIDNRHVLHSRSAFVDDPALPPRRMMRLWIQCRSQG
jgi:alpha-ketoglutarate-dependent taurine dioxygenase